jgi:dTDP-4-dehydrorhamnose reductase
MVQSKPRIVVTGAQGQLGQEFQRLASAHDWAEYIFLSQEDLDIANAEAVEKYAANHPFNYCINCAAYTAVDKAEEDKAAAFAGNVTGPANLARACRENGAQLVHISTDYVFDGTQSSPYSEADSPNPLGVYGRTKLQGEQAVIEIDPSVIVIRTSWLYSTYGRNFFNTITNAARTKEELSIVADQVGTPTYAADLAEAVSSIIQYLGMSHGGVYGGMYHYSNEGVASWYDFGQAIVEMQGLPCRVRSIESKDYPTPTARPSYSVLNKAKIKQTFGLTIPYWRQSLSRAVEHAKSL